MAAAGIITFVILYFKSRMFSAMNSMFLKFCYDIEGIECLSI